MGRRTGSLPGLLLLLALTASVLPAQARSWTIESFEALLEVQPDGTLQVTETIQPHFQGSYNGIFRTIPIDYDAPGGFNYKLFLTVEGVSDAQGEKLRCESSRQGHYRKVKIWVPGAQDATKTVVIKYRVENALRYFDDHDELYWNVTGTEWPVPIARASAQVVLPAQAAGSIRAKAFTGPWGSTRSDADISTKDNEVTVSTREGLGFREGLTVVMGWEKGVVAAPSRLHRAWLFLRSNFVLFLPVVIFAGMFWLWSARGRDPHLTRSIVPLYSPPEDMTPAELGMLADNSPDLRDVTATLVDLAVRGYVVIEEADKASFLGHKKDYLFRLRKPRAEWTGLKDHERKLLEAVFRGDSSLGDVVIGPDGTRRVTVGDAQMQQLSRGPMPAIIKRLFRVELVPASAAASKESQADSKPPEEEVATLSSLENRFYTDLPGIRDAITSALIRRGYYDRDPQKVKKTWIGVGIALAFVSFWGAIPAQVLGIAPVSVIAAMIISGLIVIAFGWVMPARTRRGTDAWAGVRGFEEFLVRVDKDRLQRMAITPDTFEKYLPYAMALGAERNWTGAFADIYREPPGWYRGDWSGGFHPWMLTNGLSSMSSQAATTFASAPRSSSSGSGFGGGGGGGFSGGGFGGGGGGAF